MVIVKYYNQYNEPINFTGMIDDNLSNFQHKRFIKNNKLHRYYGPTYIWQEGDKSWWFNNKCYGRSIDKYNQKQFLKDINKLWLL